jgi:uncharacterized membrane protein YbaN (DUF454 family)
MNSELNKAKQFFKKPVKILLIIAGTFFIGMGIVGIFVPMLPTTPFLLISVALYARSSKRFYDWLINNKFLGIYIKNYREGKGIPLKIKIFAITLLWITIGCSTFFAVDIFWVRMILGIIAIGATIYIISIRSKDKSKTVVPG